MLYDAFQPHLLDPKESPVLDAREIMARFPKRWVFVEVTEDYAPYEFDGFRGRVIAEAPTRKMLTPLSALPVSVGTRPDTSRLGSFLSQPTAPLPRGIL